MANQYLEKTKNLAVDLSDILIFLLVFFLGVHVSVAMIAYIWSPGWLSDYRHCIGENIRFNIGLPAAAVGAYGVVSLLLHVFPPEKQSGSIKLKLFGLEFTGPAGPITLWLACFLTIIAAIKWL